MIGFGFWSMFFFSSFSLFNKDDYTEALGADYYNLGKLKRKFNFVLSLGAQDWFCILVTVCYGCSSFFNKGDDTEKVGADYINLRKLKYNFLFQKD